MPYTKDGVIVAQEGTAIAISIFEDHFKDRKYLVTDRLTLADIMCAGLVSFGFAKSTLPFRSRLVLVCTVFRVLRHVATVFCSLKLSHSPNLAPKLVMLTPKSYSL